MNSAYRCAEQWGLCAERIGHLAYLIVGRGGPHASRAPAGPGPPLEGVMFAIPPAPPLARKKKKDLRPTPWHYLMTCPLIRQCFGTVFYFLFSFCFTTVWHFLNHVHYVHWEKCVPNLFVIRRNCWKFRINSGYIFLAVTVPTHNVKYYVN